MSQEELTTYFGEIALAYILRGRSDAARRLPALGDVRMHILTYLVDACETFAVAHEYGHMLAGHLSGRFDPDDDGWVKKRHQQEYEADQIATLLLFRRIDDDRLTENEMKLHLTFDPAGCLALFALEEFVETVRRHIPDLPEEPAEVSTHPPATLRYQRVRHDFAALGIEMSTADAVTSWIMERTEMVVTRLEARSAASRTI